ncbi:protein of unknown function [Streptomyces murinus]
MSAPSRDPTRSPRRSAPGPPSSVSPVPSPSPPGPSPTARPEPDSRKQTQGSRPAHRRRALGAGARARRRRRRTLRHRRQRRRHLLQRPPLRPYRQRRRHQARRAHQRRPDGERQDRVADPARAGEVGEEQRAADTAGRRTQGVEEGDGHRARLHREDLRHRQIRAGRARRGEEEDRAPARRQRRRAEHTPVEQPRRAEQQQTRQQIRRGDHHPAADRVEELAQQQRAAEVSDGDDREVVARTVRRHREELRQDRAEAEGDRVVQERLPDEEGEAEHRAPAVPPEDRVGDLPEGDALALVDGQPHVRRRQPDALLRLHLPFDAGDDLLRLLVPAVDQQPPRTLRDVPPYEQDHQRQYGAQREGQPPAHVHRQQAGVQRHDGQQRTAHRAQPEAAVDDQVDTAAVVGRDQLVDRGVDRRVLAADAEAGQEAEEEEPPGLPGDRGQGRRHQIHRQGDHEQLLTAVTVGQPAPEQRAHARARDVQRGGRARDLTGCDRQTAARFGQPAGDVADDRDLQAVQDPYGAEADHDRPVPAGPREAIEAGGDVGADGPPTATRPTAVTCPAAATHAAAATRPAAIPHPAAAVRPAATPPAAAVRPVAVTPPAARTGLPGRPRGLPRGRPRGRLLGSCHRLPPRRGRPPKREDGRTTDTPAPPFQAPDDPPSATHRPRHREDQQPRQ